MLNELQERLSRVAEGMVPTSIPFLWTLRSNQTTTLSHGVLEPSFCLVVQGAKRIQLGSEMLDYGVGSYLASVIVLPTAGQITQAPPYLALRVVLDPAEMAHVALEAGLDLAGTKSGPAAFVDQADAALLGGLVRLVRLLDDPQDAEFLASDVKREIVYRLLKGQNGPSIYHSVCPGKHDVGAAIRWLRNHYDRPLRIEELARVSNMSVSSLHHKFKTATAMGPLQYQKQLRLQEARRLLLAGELDAGGAAVQVGYESQSQFTREYRRLFGAPPLADIKALKNRPASQERILS